MGWEYLVAKSDDGNLGDVETLDRLGLEGWELVAVATFSASAGIGGSSERVAFYFKRRLIG